MHITVFGGSGKVGRLVVARLLEDGHRITVFVHSNAPFGNNVNLNIIKGDVRNAADVTKALQGSEAVISTLGSWGTKSKDIVSTGMKRIIPVMEADGIRRIISLTGSGAQAPGERSSRLDRLGRPAVELIAGKILADSEDHIKRLADSSLDWTIIRSPVMRGFGKQDYHLSLKAPAPWATVHRDAVANALVEQLDSHDFIRSAPYIVPNKML
jgi:putative NADH-flavin reductase